MEGIKCEISIPKTQLKKSNALFASSFTVLLSQLYEIHTKISGFSELIALRRYSELLDLSETLKLITTTLDIYLPKFPGKKLLKNKQSLTESRRVKIERYLQLATKHSALQKKILKFLDINLKVVQAELSSSKKSDEIYVNDFLSRLSDCKNNTMNNIDQFGFCFFSRKRNLSELVLVNLIEALVPLCGSDLYGGKVIDILSKLTSRDSFKDFIHVCRIFANTNLYLLRGMNLNDYLTRKKFADSQIQAYNLCKIYEDYCRNPSLPEILKHDEDALQIYRKWGQNEKVHSKSLSPQLNDWRPLISEGASQLKFRFIGRQVEMVGETVVDSSIVKIINLLTVPTERKRWDIKMADMRPLEKGFIFIYINDKTIYEYHTLSNIIKKGSKNIVEFSTTCYEQLEVKSVIGKISSNYVIELIDERIGSTKESQDKIFTGLASEFTLGKVRIQWTSTYCEDSFALIRKDLFQEDDSFKRSIQKMLLLAEGKDDLIENLQTEKNPILAAFERKRLAMVGSSSFIED